MIRTMRTQGWANSNQQNIASLPTLPVVSGSMSVHSVTAFTYLGANGNGSSFYCKMSESGIGSTVFTAQGHTGSGTNGAQQAHMSWARQRGRINRFRANGALAGPDQFRGWVRNAKDHDFHRTTPVNDQGIAYQVAVLTGTLTFSGAVVRRQNPFLTATLTLSGLVPQGINRALAGLLTPIGAVSFNGLAIKALAGTLTLSAELGTRFILYTKKFIVNAAKRLGYKRLNGE